MNWWQKDCLAINEKVRQEALDRQNQLTKPPGSLGVLESIAVDLAAMYGELTPHLNQPAIAIFAADHGVVAQGVSAFPQAVTVEMLRNFINGGAAISVLADLHQAQLKVVNCGTATEPDFDGVIDQRIAAGTQDLSQQAAMNMEQCEQALLIGKQLVEELKSEGCDFFIAGEMGIGNTTAAAALGCVYTQVEAEQMVGLGTGVDEHGLQRKKDVVNTALQRIKTEELSAIELLAQLGGFEIAAITGAYIRCAQLGIPVLVDGFITTAAALAAEKMNPGVRDWLIFSHQSEEQGHGYMLAELQGKALLQLGMRLGEGSGAAVALPLIKEACALHSRMATFAEASVSEA
jgi:nicotinate-nucleotide--dimethylbenzimidazole phosphoribosyltransferase